MIVYSVTINVEDMIHHEWLRFMQHTHIPDVLNTGLFSGHKMYKLLTRFEGETGTTYNIQYYLNSLSDYEKYQEEFAPALQKDVIDRYDGKFMTFRTLLEEV